MNNEELTDLVRRCHTVIPKENMSGRFYESPGLDFRWYGNTESNRLMIDFPDYLREAPCPVLMDLTKKVIQRALYGSTYTLSEITKSWLMTELHSSENVRTYIQRNGFTVIRQYEDVIVVSSDNDEVDWSLFFRVVSIPKHKIDSPELEGTIAETYDVIKLMEESFMEA